MAFEIDDQLERDPRFVALRLRSNFSDALALLVLFGVQCASERTDGRLFRSVAAGLLPISSKRNAEALAALVHVGFLVDHAELDEYEYVGFLDLNESSSAEAPV